MPADVAAVGNRSLRDRIDQGSVLHEFFEPEQEYCLRDHLIAKGKGSGRGGSSKRSQTISVPGSIQRKENTLTTCSR